MKIDPAGEKQIREFLLGRLPQRQAEELEEKLLVDDELEELVHLVEDEIIDQYVDGDLDPRDRGDTDNHFLLPPARRKKLALAKILRERLRPKPLPPDPGFLRLPLLFAGTSAAWLLVGLLSMVSVGSGFYIVGLRKDRETQAQKLREQTELAANHNNSSPQKRLSTQIINFEAGDFKSAGPGETVEISENTGLIEAHIPLFDGPSPVNSYAVKIQNEEGKQIASESNLKPNSGGGGSELIINIDPKVMTSGTWIALVTPNRIGAPTDKFYCPIR